MAGVVINPGCRISRHCIVNAGSCLDHESTIGDFFSLALGVVTDRKEQICAGAVVVKNVLANMTAMGVPARVTRKWQSGEKYL